MSPYLFSMKCWFHIQQPLCAYRFNTFGKIFLRFLYTPMCSEKHRSLGMQHSRYSNTQIFWAEKESACPSANNRIYVFI